MVDSYVLYMSTASASMSIVVCVVALYLYYPLHILYRRSERDRNNESSINFVLVMLLVVNMLSAVNIFSSAVFQLTYGVLPSWLCTAGGVFDQFSYFSCSCLMTLFVVNVKMVLTKHNTDLQSMNIICVGLIMMMSAGVVSISVSEKMILRGPQAWCMVLDEIIRIPFWVADGVAAVAAVAVFAPLLKNPKLNKYEVVAIRYRFAFSVFYAFFNVLRAVSVANSTNDVATAATAFVEPLQGSINGIIFVVSEGLWNFLNWNYEGVPYGFAYGITSLSFRLDRATVSPLGSSSPNVRMPPSSSGRGNNTSNQNNNEDGMGSIAPLSSGNGHGGSDDAGCGVTDPLVVQTCQLGMRSPSPYGAVMSPSVGNRVQTIVLDDHLDEGILFGAAEDKD
eukprot:PhF_6_TR40953/c0_g1_i1/m.61981